MSAPQPVAYLSRWTLLRLAIVWSLVLAFELGGGSAPLSWGTAAVSFALLFGAILMASFGVVREADQLASQLGEPYGTLILTLSVVTIEVILIAAVLLGPGEVSTIGRDSIFAVMMIIMNLVLGVCLVAGGRRYGEQEYNAGGATAYLSMIAVLTAIAMLLPNTLQPGDGTFRPGQAIALSVLTLLLYGAFLWMQMKGHRRLFLQPPAGTLTMPLRQAPAPSDTAPARDGVWLRSGILLASLLPIVLLSRPLARVLDYGVEQTGAPVALSGVLIALIVFTPESITAVRAALRNELQRSLNLCLGAFVSTIGLTVPAVLLIGLLAGRTVVLGVRPAEALLLILTVALSVLTFSGRRTSALQGLLHLMLFGVFGVLLLSR